MWSRRQLVLGGAAATAAPLLPGCSANAMYQQAVTSVWRHPSAATDTHAEMLRTLVHYATLAPSSHNTQCWRFAAGDHLVRIAPDFGRRCPAVDPDDHHLFVSIGCAVENLRLAAEAHGLHADVQFDGESASVTMTLAATTARRSPLFEAIPERQSTRGDYDGRPLSSADLRLLEQASACPGVRMIVITERRAVEQVLELVVAGNTAQLDDAAFVRELTAWIRFSEAEAVRTGDGVFAGSSGNPTVPRWLGQSLMPFVLTAASDNARYVNRVRSSAGLAVFVGERADPRQWVDVGRCYERFALQATALGIRTAFLNQPVEVSTVRPQFASWLGVGSHRPDLLVRFGRGPTMPRSLRRPIDAVLV
jgi:Nitroreductase family/TAT (twin-arginine translocation) pathway signal sequence